MAKKHGYFPTASYPMPMPRNGQNIGHNRQGEQSVVTKALEDNNNGDLLTIEQHQQRVNTEIAGREQV